MAFANPWSGPTRGINPFTGAPIIPMAAPMRMPPRPVGRPLPPGARFNPWGGARSREVNPFTGAAIPARPIIPAERRLPPLVPKTAAKTAAEDIAKEAARTAEKEGWFARTWATRRGKIGFGIAGAIAFGAVTHRSSGGRTQQTGVY